MSVDQNQAARNSSFKSCLYTAGWVPVKDKAGAIAMNNSMPALSPAMSRPVDPAAPAQANPKAKKYCDGIFPSNPGMMAAFESNYDLCVSTRSHEIAGTK